MEVPLTFLARCSRPALLTLAALLASAGPLPLKAEEARKAPAVTVKVGDPAPAFVHGAWLKGAPLTSFARGQIYVLEFWGTHCGACVAAMPHVTELAKTYAGKVTFIGVNVLESDKNLARTDRRVAAFVKAKGDTMDYLVCRDTADGAMWKTWMQASGMPAIPATFVVDGAGRLVWRGHPTALDPVLEQLVAGHFDAAATEVTATTNEGIQRAILEALKAKEWQKALDLTGTYHPAEKDDQTFANNYKFQALLHLDPKAAEGMFDRAAAIPDSEDAGCFATTIAYEEGLPATWYARAVPVLEKAAKDEKGLLGVLSQVQIKAGDPASAAKSKALEIEDFKGKLAFILENHPEQGAPLKQHLEKLEAERKAYLAAASH
jgi:thiol-disulfide isomerase/thioredoxin